MSNPSNVSASVSGSTVTVTWTNNPVTAMPDPSGMCSDPYRVENRIMRRPASGGSSVEEATAGASATSASFTVPDGEWVFVVQARIREYVYIDGNPGFCQSSDSYPTSGESNSINVGQNKTPDPFSFSEKVNQPVDEWIYSNTVTIQGLDVSVPVEIQSGLDRQFQVDGESWQSGSATLSPGDTLRLRLRTGGFSRYMQTWVRVGDPYREVEWEVTTQDPGGQVVIPGSGTISFDIIRGMWGPPPGETVSMDDWLRGGPYLQEEHPENDQVPTSLPIEMDDFRGCKGVWEIEGLEDEYGDSQAESAGVSITGKNPNIPLECRYFVSGNPSGNFSVSPANHEDWRLDGDCRIDYEGPEGGDPVSGTITIEVRALGQSSGVSINRPFQVGSGGIIN